MTRRYAIALALLGALAAAGAAGGLVAGARARGPRSDPRLADSPPRMPLVVLKGRFRVINAHEHIKQWDVAWRLLRAMDEVGIERTVLCAGAKMTTHHPKKYGFEGWRENNQEVLRIARRRPDRFVPFVTLRPGLPDALDLLRGWVARGARGLKLYSGHGSFRRLRLEDGSEREFALDDPSMMPVYEWAEREQLPILWHVNTGVPRVLEEFRRVLDRFPRLRVNCPHHCMALGRLDLLRDLLRSYPNLYTDTSHGYHVYMQGALRRISARRDAFRALYAEFPDRFLWGTDVVVTGHRAKKPRWIAETASAYFGLFGQETFHLPVYGRDWSFQGVEELPGLGLDEAFLRKMYWDNPRRFLHLDEAK